MPQRIEVPGHGIVEFPDGMDEAAIVKAIQSNMQPPAAVKAGSTLMQIPRQVGLFARHGLEGLPALVEPVTEPLRQLVTNPVARAVGLPEGKSSATGLGRQAADWLGLPKPETANERVVGDASRGVAGVLGGGGIARGLSSSVTAAKPMLQAGLSVFGNNIGTQGLAAAGSGLFGGSVREAGGTPGMELAASVLGGVATPMAANGLASVAGRGANAAKAMMAPKRVEQEIEQQIQMKLQGQGVDWNGLTKGVQNQIRDQVRQATANGGTISGDALRRLIDFQRTGLTPTRGSLTLDPIQITREKNLAKTSANSLGSSDHLLSTIENQNNSGLIRNLNDLGASPDRDAFAQGSRLFDSLGRVIDRNEQSISGLYRNARDTAGRSAELDGYAFTQRANQLMQENLAGKLPGQIEDLLNNIALGKNPLTVDHAEQIKTALGRLQRGTMDGNERHTLGLIRQALDEAPLKGAAQVNPGNLPAVAGTVPPSTGALGQESIDAFNQARYAHRSFMGQLESTPALAAVRDGAHPDDFVNRFIVGGKAADLGNLRQALGNDAQGVEAVRQSILDHLKGKAIGGAADEVGNFSQSAYNGALRKLGREKLSHFFTSQEIDQMEAVGRVASYTQFQPRGSAVNNSNSGALVVGRGLDLLGALASKAPLGMDNMLTGTIKGMQQRQALKVSPGLLTPEELIPLSDRFKPAVAPLGLLSAQLAQ